jgi:hypothetical protein
MAETSSPGPVIGGLVNAGDVIIKQVWITGASQSADITNFVVEINIYEDLFGNALHGDLVLRDTINLISSIPIMGNEIVSIECTTPGQASEGIDFVSKIQKSFVTYGVKNRMLTNGDKEQVYILKFMSLEAAMDNVSFISEKIEGRTDELVEKIYTERIAQPRYFTSTIVPGDGDKTALVVGDTPHESNVSFVPAFWTPFQCLNYIATRSIGGTSKSPTFLFFETLHSFYFTSIENLISTQMEAGSFGGSYIYMSKTHGERNTFAALVSSFGKVEKVKFLTQLDMLQGQDTGHYTSMLYTFDMVKKEVTQNIYDHGIEADSYTHIEDYSKNTDGKFAKDEARAKLNTVFPPNIMRSANSKMFIKTIHPGVTDNKDDKLMNLHPEMFVQNRNSLFLDVNTLKLSIQVPGRTDMHVGKIVEFKYPSVKSKTVDMRDEDFYDKYISGFYIITAIHHQITKLRHTMNMEIAKDSLVTALVTEAQMGTNTTSTTPQTTVPPTTQTGN